MTRRLNSYTATGIAWITSVQKALWLHYEKIAHCQLCVWLAGVYGFG